MQRTNLRVILLSSSPMPRERGCHAPCSGHVEPGSPSSDPPRLLTLQLQPHGRRFRTLGGPGFRLQPPLHVVAASQLPHASFATRVANSDNLSGEPEPSCETSGLRMRKSRTSAAEGWDWRPDLPEREVLAEEAGVLCLWAVPM